MQKKNTLISIFFVFLAQKLFCFILIKELYVIEPLRVQYGINLHEYALKSIKRAREI